MIKNHTYGGLFCFISSDTREEVESTLTKEGFFILGNTVFNPGTRTDFDGYWNRPLLYIGNKKQEMYFYIGEDKGRHYYEYFHYITTNRFCINTYNGQSARDFNFANGVWCFNKMTAKKKNKLIKSEV